MSQPTSVIGTVSSSQQTQPILTPSSQVAITTTTTTPAVAIAVAAPPNSGVIPYASASTPPTISALNAAVFVQSKIFYEKHAQESLEMASLTKIMTLFCSLKLCLKYHLDVHTTYVQVPRFAAFICGTIAGLRAGEHLSLFDLFHALMLPSGNDAACVLASFFGSLEQAATAVGSSLKKSSQSTQQSAQRSTNSNNNPPEGMLIPSILDESKQILVYSQGSNINADFLHSNMKYFVRFMNLEAMKLQMRSTQFSNPHGLSDKANRSSAVDLARLCYTAMTIFPLFRSVVKTIRHTATTIVFDKSNQTNQTSSVIAVATAVDDPATSSISISAANTNKFTGNVMKKLRDVSWTNTNKLLEKDPRFVGIKTGSTPNAGFCLATHFTKGDTHLYIVVFKCRDQNKRWTDTVKLAEWAFAVIDSEKMPSVIINPSINSSNNLSIDTAKQVTRIPVSARSRSALIWNRTQLSSSTSSNPTHNNNNNIIAQLPNQQQQQQQQQPQLTSILSQQSLSNSQSTILPRIQRARPVSILSSIELDNLAGGSTGGLFGTISHEEEQNNIDSCQRYYNNNNNKSGGVNVVQVATRNFEDSFENIEINEARNPHERGRSIEKAAISNIPSIAPYSVSKERGENSNRLAAITTPLANCILSQLKVNTNKSIMKPIQDLYVSVGCNGNNQSTVNNNNNNSTLIEQAQQGIKSLQSSTILSSSSTAATSAAGTATSILNSSSISTQQTQTGTSLLTQQPQTQNNTNSLQSARFNRGLSLKTPPIGQTATTSAVVIRVKMLSPNRKKKQFQPPAPIQSSDLGVDNHSTTINSSHALSLPHQQQHQQQPQQSHQPALFTKQRHLSQQQQQLQQQYSQIPPASFNASKNNNNNNNFSSNRVASDVSVIIAETNDSQQPQQSIEKKPQKNLFSASQKLKRPNTSILVSLNTLPLHQRVNAGSTVAHTASTGNPINSANNLSDPDKKQIPLAQVGGTSQQSNSAYQTGIASTSNSIPIGQEMPQLQSQQQTNMLPHRMYAKQQQQYTRLLPQVQPNLSIIPALPPHANQVVQPIHVLN